MTDDRDPLVEALQRKVNTQADRIEDLEDRLGKLEELVDPDPGATGYEQLTKDQKVFRVRRHLLERADKTNGRAAMKYKEIMMLFDGHPSPGHCYDLMERAGTIDGFEYDEAGGGKGEKRVRVSADAVNDETLIHAANKGTDTVHA